MMYDSLLARSFSKREQKQLGYGALFACLFTAFVLLNSGPVPALNFRLSIGKAPLLKTVNDTNISPLVSKEITINNASMVNDTSNSQQIVSDVKNLPNHTETTNDTSSLLKIDMAVDVDLMVKAAPIVNGTSSSRQIEVDVIASNSGILNDSSTRRQIARDAVRVKKLKPICNSTERSDFCEVKGGDIRIDGRSATVFVVTSETDILAAENTSWSIKPYARKGDIAAMSLTREWSVKIVASGNQNIPQCTQKHNVPAILFSLGGYSGNHFHAFTDIIVPLFATARPFNRDVQFLMTNKQSYWIEKFGRLVKALSRNEFIDIDQTRDIHCFTSAIVGLKGRSNKELSIDPSQSAYSMKQFKQFLRDSYSLKKTNAAKIRDGQKKKPRLLIISRKRSRAFTNVGEIARMAKRLGFKVVIHEPDMDVAKGARIMNSCDVVMGVHGAGLTNSVFLPENAILIQIIPFGGAEWISRAYFEEPAKDMNIRYLDYKIKLEESTLMQQYPPDNVVLRDPSVIGKKGWMAFKEIYLDKQNVKLDVNRFRPTLLKALELLHQ